MLSITSFVNALIYLVAGGIIFGVLWWFVGVCKLREPFDYVARVVLAFFAVLVIIGVVLSFVTETPIFKP